MLVKRPSIEKTSGGTVLRAGVSCNGRESSCFYSVPERFADFADTESSNCFLAGLLYPAMRYGEDIHVEGTVSARLLYNMNEYLIPMLSSCDARLKRISVSADSTSDAGCPGAAAAGTGFSGGIDSFATICRHIARTEPPGFRLSHLFFFNVGAHGIPRGPGDTEAIARKFRARYAKLAPFPEEAGLPFVPVDSNIHEFHPWGHLEVATLATVSAALFLQRGIRRYYLASAGHPYAQLWRYLGSGRRPDDIAYLNPLILPWLSTETLDFVDDGTFMDRSQKTVLVADYEPASRYLNVCSSHDTLDTNCSVCPKCCRTLLTLELIGKTDAFRSVFDVEKFRREARRLYIAQTLVHAGDEMFYRHLVDLARERGVDLRREVNALDLFRARMCDGRLHSFIRGNPLLKRLAKKFFRK